MPEYIHVEESVRTVSSTVYVESKLTVTDVETNDVGYYVCLYASTIHLYDDRHHSTNNSIYLYVTGNLRHYSI